MGGWQTNIPIPGPVDRRCRVKACRLCEAPIRIVEDLREQGGRHEFTVVDAVPRTDGWMFLFDDGYGTYAPLGDGRRPALLEDGRVVASFRIHRHVTAQEHAGRHWGRVRTMVEAGFTRRASLREAPGQEQTG